SVRRLGRSVEQRALVLTSCHAFHHTPPVRLPQRPSSRAGLAHVRYVYSQRLNLRPIRSDIDAMWDFAPHDISIIQYWLDDQEPTSVLRQGMDCIQPGIDDVVFLSPAYPSKVIANVHVSRLDPHKVRKMVMYETWPTTKSPFTTRASTA